MNQTQSLIDYDRVRKYADMIQLNETVVMVYSNSRVLKIRAMELAPYFQPTIQLVGRNYDSQLSFIISKSEINQSKDDPIAYYLNRITRELKFYDEQMSDLPI